MADDLEKIEKLIGFMEEHGLTELQVRQGELEFRARRGERQQMPFVFQPAQGLVNEAVVQNQQSQQAASSGPVPAVAAEPPAAKEPEGGADANHKEICSPIVGTFYRRPNPTSPPYKDVGDRVEKGDVVSIVEAMKVMNENKADVSGTIKKALVEDATPVEFGQPLFLVELG